MAKRLLTLIHGDKGGIGKSLTGNTVADYRLDKGLGNPLVIVDADQRNPDVARMYQDITVKINLLTHQGWNELYDLIHERSDSDFLVNLPAQAGMQIPHEKETLQAFLAEQNMDLLMMFPIDRLNDTVNLLKFAVAELGPICKSNIVVIKNLFFGEASKFDKFDRSDVRQFLVDNGAKIIEMPELNPDVVSAVMGDYHGEVQRKCQRFTALLASNPRPSLKFDLDKWLRVMFEQYDTIFAPYMEAPAPAPAPAAAPAPTKKSKGE